MIKQAKELATGASDVFLTVHHGINVFNYQFDEQFPYSVIYVLH
jgi:hypothetical protein